MKKYLFFCALVLGLLCPAVGEAATGIYVGPKIGFSHTSLTSNSINLHWNDTADPRLHDASASLDDAKESGLSGGFFVGYNFETRLNVPIRVELDTTFRTLGVDERHVSTLHVGSGATAHINVRYKLNSSISVMNNLWLDVPVADFPVRPYVGGGIGAGLVTYDTDSAFGGSPVMLFQEENTGSSGVFAWMLGAGASYQLNRLITLDLGYRYTQAKNIEIDLIGFSDADFQLQTSTQSHDFMLGVRFTL